MGLETLKLIPPTSNDLGSIHCGGEPELTASLVSGALGIARLSDNASYYCRIKYQLDDSTRCKLLNNITKNYILPWAVENSWQCKIDILPRLAETALYESMVSSCETCNGRKEVVINGKVHLCQKCKGSGKLKLTIAEIARRLKTDGKNYERVWKNRYYRVLTLFYNLDNEIDNALKKIGN